MVAGVGGAGHDRVRAVGYGVLVRRTAFHNVVACEDRIGIAKGIGNRSGGNGGCQAATGRNVDHEARGHGLINHGDRADSRTLNAA